MPNTPEGMPERMWINWYKDSPGRSTMYYGATHPSTCVEYVPASRLTAAVGLLKEAHEEIATHQVYMESESLLSRIAAFTQEVNP